LRVRLELTVKNWEPPADLTRLLDALANDVVVATDAEVSIASTEGTPWTRCSSRRALAMVIRMRGLIEDMIDEPSEARERALVPEFEAVREIRQRPH
jgi:hypothetical protein